MFFLVIINGFCWTGGEGQTETCKAEHCQVVKQKSYLLFPKTNLKLV